MDHDHPPIHFNPARFVLVRLVPPVSAAFFYKNRFHRFLMSTTVHYTHISQQFGFCFRKKC